MAGSQAVQKFLRHRAHKHLAETITKQPADKASGCAALVDVRVWLFAPDAVDLLRFSKHVAARSLLHVAVLVPFCWGWAKT